MISTAPQPSTSFVRTQSVVLLPGEKFFVRRIQLAPGQNAAEQVELALETFGPFSPGQIFHGFCPSRDGKQALLFAAYRKNFTSEEIASWTTADVVLPEFALWLAPASAPPAGVWLHEHNDGLQLIAWDGNDLPAGLLFRKTDVTTPEIATRELLEEAAKRFGVPAGSPRHLGGNFIIDKWSKEGLSLKLDKPGQTMAAQLPVAAARSMDVRDKAELVSLSQQQKRNLWLWRAFAGMAAALALCAVAEIGLQVAGSLLERQKAVVQANTPAVQQIEQASSLAARMEQMAGQRLKPFEMLALINAQRPHSMTFVSASTSSSTQMDLKAEATNVADMSNFDSALRKTPGIEKVELSNQSSQASGVTSFNLKVVFKAGFSLEGGGK